MKQMHIGVAALLLSLSMPGCAAVLVTGTAATVAGGAVALTAKAAGSAVKSTAKGVGAAAKLTAKGVGKAAGLVTGSRDSE